MIATTIRYTMPPDTDWASIHSLLIERSAIYLDMRGLISKAFLYNPELGLYGGNYVWESAEDFRRFKDSETFKKAVERFGEPRIEVSQIATYLDRGQVYSAD